MRDTMVDVVTVLDSLVLILASEEISLLQNVQTSPEAHQAQA
jgi:hypothetical protein